MLYILSFFFPQLPHAKCRNDYHFSAFPRAPIAFWNSSDCVIASSVSTDALRQAHSSEYKGCGNRDDIQPNPVVQQLPC